MNKSRIDYKKFLRKRLPITKWLPQYTISTLLQDILAGVTVGMTEIPQGIAYAALAGLPPQYGLYSGLVDGFIYALFGGCKDLNVGPSSLLSVMVLSPVATFGTVAAILLTFFSGFVIFVLGVMNLGFVIGFFSYPVITGFIWAGGVQVLSSQLKTLLGIPGPSDSFLATWESIVGNFGEVRKWDTVLGVCSILLLVPLREVQVFGSLQHRSDWSAMRNFFGKIIFFLSSGASALVLVMGTAISYSYASYSPFQLTGNITTGLPQFQAPDFSNFGDVISNFSVTFVLIPLISILESAAIARAFSSKIDATQEMIAIGLCNIVGSFFGSMPVTGSLSRSAVNNASGVRTTLAGVFTSLVLLLVIAFLTSTFYYVPKATLSAILISACVHILDWRVLSLLWRNKKLDLIPFFTTFFCGLFISIEYGLLIGAIVNILFILYASARPKFDITEETIGNEIRIITPRDTLYFPAAEYLRDTAVIYKGEDMTVIVNGKYIRNIDITVAKSVAALADELTSRNHKIFFLDFKQSIVDICVRVDKKLKNHFFSEEHYKSIANQDFVTV